MLLVLQTGIEDALNRYSVLLFLQIVNYIISFFNAYTPLSLANILFAILFWTPVSAFI